MDRDVAWGVHTATVRRLHSIITNERLPKRTQIRAAAVLPLYVEDCIDRYDPKPKQTPDVHLEAHGPVVLRWNLGQEEIPPASASPPTALKSGSSNGSNGSTSSSATGDGEKPPSA